MMIHLLDDQSGAGRLDGPNRTSGGLFIRGDRLSQGEAA